MVKRVGYLMPRITTMTNLHEAFLRAVRGKGGKREVVRFRRHLDDNLRLLQRQLTDGTFRFGDYRYFTVFDPKQRTICAAAFRERVAAHAVMRICHPVLDAYQVDDSFASRKGKGQYAALQRAQHYACRYPWFAKLDMRKYFDSICHDVVVGQLQRLFKDPALLRLFRQVIDSYHTTPGRGLPIGNLTSQYFANHYLAPADHYAKEQLHAPGLVRYMDDILLFADTPERLKDIIARYRQHVEDTLHLQMHAPVVNRTHYGIPFLGYVVYADRLRLHQCSRRRFRQKMQTLTTLYNGGHIDEHTYTLRATCLQAFITKAETTQFIRHTIHQQGMYPQSVQPREPRRQLEQQRQELPRIQP